MHIAVTIFHVMLSRSSRGSHLGRCASRRNADPSSRTGVSDNIAAWRMAVIVLRVVVGLGLGSRDSDCVALVSSSPSN